MRTGTSDLGGFSGHPMKGVKITASDTAQLLPSAYMGGAQTKLTDGYGNQAVTVLITCEDYDIRFAAGGASPTASSGHVLASGDSLLLSGETWVNTFRFVNKTAGSNATLFVTPMY